MAVSSPTAASRDECASRRCTSSARLRSVMSCPMACNSSGISPAPSMDLKVQCCQPRLPSGKVTSHCNSPGPAPDSACATDRPSCSRVSRRQVFTQLPAQHLLALLAEKPAIRLIDEGQSQVWRKAAHELCLAVHHGAISLLALAQRRFLPPAVGDVDRRTDEAYELARDAVTRYAASQDPAVHAVTTPQSIVHLEFAARRETRLVDSHATLLVVGVH